MECQPCGLGNWTDEPGMSECHRCGEDVTSNQLQLELFTTSKKVSTGHLHAHDLGMSELRSFWCGQVSRSCLEG